VIGMGKTSTAIRAALIGALIALGLSIAFLAQQERTASLAIENGAWTDLSSVPGKLRIALALLLISMIAIGYVIFAVARRNAAEADRTVEVPDAAQAAAIGQLSDPNAIGPLLSAEAGQMISTGGLMRRFCHELNNTLSPVQGYAELLVNDERLSDLHRRHVTKIAQSAAIALQDIQRFASALNWSGRRGTPVHLDKTVAAAAAVAQSAIGARLAVDIQQGGNVQITATEAELGLAVLHACAAIGPLLAERDMKIDIRVDSVVGAASSDVDDGVTAGRRLEIWSDPFEPARTKVQFGALRGSWRYGRVRFECAGHGWPPELAGRLFNSDLPDEDVSCLFMTILGRLIVDLGGAIMVDTRPLQYANLTMLWPTRIASQVAAPLELDTAEDDLDALIVDPAEAAAEALSRRLESLGLRVASTTSSETALELLAEMGPRCRAVMIGQAVDAALAEQVRAIAPDCLVILGRPGSGDSDEAGQVWPMEPDQGGLERLVARLRGNNSTRAS
jgi:CheY-like chemotaxis protein